MSSRCDLFTLRPDAMLVLEQKGQAILAVEEQLTDPEMGHDPCKDPARVSGLVPSWQAIEKAWTRKDGEVPKTVPMGVAVVDTLREPSGKVRCTALEPQGIFELDTQSDLGVLSLAVVSRLNDGIQAELST